jgi:hypothetical protein
LKKRRRRLVMSFRRGNIFKMSRFPCDFAHNLKILLARRGSLDSALLWDSSANGIADYG